MHTHDFAESGYSCFLYDAVAHGYSAGYFADNTDDREKHYLPKFEVSQEKSVTVYTSCCRCRKTDDLCHAGNACEPRLMFLRMFPYDLSLPHRENL